MIQNSGTVTKMRKAWAMTSEAIGSDLKLMKGLLASMVLTQVHETYKLHPDPMEILE